MTQEMTQGLTHEAMTITSGFGGSRPSDPGVFSGPLVLARILSGANGGEGEWGNGRNLQAAFQALPSLQQEQIRNRWGSHLNEIFSLSRETDAELFHEALFHLGQRLERAGRVEQAGLIYSTLLPPLPHSPIPPFSTAPAAIQQQAQERMEVLNGGGIIGQQMEHMGRGFARQALDPGLLLGATGMGLFGKGIELVGMRYLAGANFFRSASGIARTALEIAPRATGFALEATAFPFAINGANELLGRPVSWAHMDHRILGSWFFLGGMRAGGGFGRMASQRFGIPGLQPLGSIAGVGLGHGGEVLAGLQEWHGFSNFAVQTFGTWANLQVAGRFSEYVFDGQISRMQRVMDLSIESRRREGETERGRFREWVDSISEAFNNFGGPTPLAATPGDGAIPSPSRRLSVSPPRPRPLEEGRSYTISTEGGGSGSEPPSSGTRVSENPPESGTGPRSSLPPRAESDGPRSISQETIAPEGAPAAMPPPPPIEAGERRILSLDELARAEGIPLPPRYLFITGGSSGIGADMALQAKARGYQVLFGGSRAFGDLSPDLQRLGVANYLQMDVTSPEAIGLFRDIALSRHETNPGPMLVMASAGISARKGEAEIQRMREINVEGTRRLLEAFGPGLSQQPGSRFVGVGSIVAAENAAVRGDEAYQQTKRQIHEIILAMGQQEGSREVEGFTLVPGAVDTPMTRKEMIFGLLMLQAVNEGMRENSPLRPHLAALVGGEGGLRATPAEILRQVLGDALTQAPNFQKLDRFLAKDPALATRLQLMIADQLVQEPGLQEAVVRALSEMDLVIPPTLVAERTLDQFEGGEIPADLMLKVYSRHGANHIIRLLAPAESGGSAGGSGQGSETVMPPTIPATPEAGRALSQERITTPAPAPLELPPPPGVAVEPPPPPSLIPNPPLSAREQAIQALQQEMPTSVSGLSSKGVKRISEVEVEQNAYVDSHLGLTYAMATGNTRLAAREIWPTGMDFSRGYAGIVKLSEEARMRARRVSEDPEQPSAIPAPIHYEEDIRVYQPRRFDQPHTVRVTREKMRGKEGGRQIVGLSRRFQDMEGDTVSEAGTTLFIEPAFKAPPPVLLKPEDRAALPEKPILEEPVTGKLVDDFIAGSGDANPVHVSDASAAEMGLTGGRILHGMATFNLAEKAHDMHRDWEGPTGPYRVRAKWVGMVRPEAQDGSRTGDVLRFFPHKVGDADRITVLNQRDELVMTWDYWDLPPSEVPRNAAPVKPEEILPVTQTYGRATIEVNVPAGYQLVRRSLERQEPYIPTLRKILASRPDQPWVVAGNSDGMGFNLNVALLGAGARNLVGDFFEPDVLLKKKIDVQMARVARAEGLRVFAGEMGANFEGFYQDLVLPRWSRGEDGNVRVDHQPIPDNLRRAIEAAQRRSWVPDIHLINSIAFALHISPAPGVERLTGVPSIDREGRIILMDMKKYEEGPYQQKTIDPMGRNHEALLRGLTPYFGPNSTSYFLTWAGGSQNMQILHGVYGGGALGEAKEIGETAAIRYHLESQDRGFDRGYHKIIRFPDFLSFALFGIPGGGGMGLIAHQVMTRHGRYHDVPELAAQSLIKALGGENNLRNVASQIELDAAETYHIAEIKKNLEEFHHRVARYRQEHPEWNGQGALPIEASREILLGSAVHYRRDHPELEGQPIPTEVWEQLLRSENRPLVTEDYADHIPQAWD